MKLNLGGTEAKDGWKILNIQRGPDVDYVGDITDLSRFRDGSVEAIYASHVLEHLDYASELGACFGELHRVLTDDGVAMISVPDFEILAQLFLSPELTQQDKYSVMRIIMGGQMDPHDYHKMAFTQEFMVAFAVEAGFRIFERVAEFGLFDDCSNVQVAGVPISLNCVLTK